MKSQTSSVGPSPASAPLPVGSQDADLIREQQIAERAYFRALERGFLPGYELEDWLQAEAEVMERYKRDSPCLLPE